MVFVIEMLELHQGNISIEGKQMHHAIHFSSGRCNVQTEETVLGAVHANPLTNTLRFNIQ
jgi:hypothetical protein